MTSDIKTSPKVASALLSESENVSTGAKQGDIPTRSKLFEQIPLVPPPPIDCNNLGNLDSTGFVNVVLEQEQDSNCESSSFFRISDDQNNEVCRIVSKMNYRRNNRLEMTGVTHLECLDATNKTVLLIGYPVGLGEVALLSPNGDLIGECTSNVAFFCLSVKVKYNYYDVNGSRLMKMTALFPDEGDVEKKFILMVKRSQEEKLALIKMGSLRKCCHIKFKRECASLMDRLQIISLWTGFMHNEITDSTQKQELELKCVTRSSNNEKLPEVFQDENPTRQEQRTKSSPVGPSSPSSNRGKSKLKAIQHLVNTRFSRSSSNNNDNVSK